jgi:hypothetical protein
VKGNTDAGPNETSAKPPLQRDIADADGSGRFLGGASLLHNDTYRIKLSGDVKCFLLLPSLLGHGKDSKAKRLHATRRPAACERLRCERAAARGSILRFPK